MSAAIIAVMRLKPEGLWPSAAKRREMRIDAETAAIQSTSVSEQNPQSAAFAKQTIPPTSMAEQKT